MIVPKVDFWERLKQSYDILKDDFINMTIYFITFTIISALSLSLIWTFILSLAMKFASFNKETWIDANSYINMWYFAIIYFIIFISLTVLYIPFFISLIKNINDKFNWEVIDKNESLSYWFKNTWKIMNTYWYIFKYVWLIPALILIVWLLVTFQDKVIWIIIIVLSLFIFIYFSIFRWLKSFFSLLYAISYNDYTEKNFLKAIDLTKNRLMDIFINIVWLWIIFWLIGIWISILTWFLPTEDNSFISMAYGIYQDKDTIDIPTKLKEISAQMTPTTFSVITWIINKIISWFTASLFSTFWFIFYFLLFKSYENQNIQEDGLIEIINE